MAELLTGFWFWLDPDCSLGVPRGVFHSRVPGRVCALHSRIPGRPPREFIKFQSGEYELLAWTFDGRTSPSGNVL